MANHFDIIVIGSGAGGGPLAQRLAPTGKKILILERGEHIPREAANWDSKAVFIDKKYRTKEHWYDRRGKPFVPNTHYWVGGNTTFYGAALMRLREGDFHEVTHKDGVSPEWPMASTPPKRATSRLTPFRPCMMIPASLACAPIWRLKAGGPSPCRSASTWIRIIPSPAPASSARPAAATPVW